LQDQHKKDAITLLSSAGLVYKYFGKEIIDSICKTEYNRTLDTDMIEKLHKKLYNGMILEIDAGDCGVDVAAETRYNINTDLPGRVAGFNEPWNAPKGFYNQHNQFKKAMKICEEEFLRQVYHQVVIKLPAYEIVKKAFDDREKFHPSGLFLYFDSYAPWQSHLFKIEEESGNQGLIKFAFYKDERNMIRIQTVPGA
jgi:uncharacterized UPF0160 family protein